MYSTITIQQKKEKKTRLQAYDISTEERCHAGYDVLKHGYVCIIFRPPPPKKGRSSPAELPYAAVAATE